MDDDDEDDDDDDDDDDESSYDSEEIIETFEKAMEMLRHHSHGFNLETSVSPSTDLYSHFNSVKEMLKNGDFLDTHEHVEDWGSRPIQPNKPTDLEKITDYIYSTSSFGETPDNNAFSLKKVPQERRLNLKQLLKEDAELV